MRRASFIIALLLSLPVLPATSSGEPKTLTIDRMGSLAELRGELDNLHTQFNAIAENKQPLFELQKTIAEKSGECISRVVELSQKADLSQQSETEAYKSFFLRNRDLLLRMLAYNQNRVDDLLEAKLEQSEDKEAFFKSPEWEQPRYLIAAVSYWLGWNNYYASLLYKAGDQARLMILDEAVSGFTRTLPDLQDRSLANRCMLGRALCFKEQMKYDKALQDIRSLMAAVPRGDLLYAQAGYENALINHLSGKNELALKQIQELLAGDTTAVIPRQIKDQLKNLQAQIALDLVEKKTSAPDAAHAKESYDEAIRKLKQIAEADAAQAGVLYRYVFDHAEKLSDQPEDVLGSIGNLAIADWHFERKEYDAAGGRYRRMYDRPDSFIDPYFDGLCFRLAYCYARKQQWQDALACLETLFQKYPGSSFDGKAACLYHAVAAQAYQSQPSEKAYARYVKAAESYVKNCPESQDKSEAHFQLGRYYQQQGRMQEAIIQFQQVVNDSPHYPEARHAVLLITLNELQSDVEELEALMRDGQGQSDKAIRLQRESLRRAEDCQKRFTLPQSSDDEGLMRAHMTLLLARLYLHASDPSPRKALQQLKGFEERFAINQQKESLHGMAKKLRLECYLQLGLLKEADQEIARIAAQGTVDEKTWALLNQFADRYYTLAKQNPSGPEAHNITPHSARSLTVYTRLADIAANNPSYNNFYDSILMRLAELYTMENKLPQAAAICRERLESHPDSGDGMYNLARIYEKEEKWEDAYKNWNKLARSLKSGSKEWFEARYHMAQALIRLGKPKDACDVIIVTRSNYSDQGNEALKDTFMKLEGECCTK